MRQRYRFWPLLLLALCGSGGLFAQDDGLARVKERELEQVRERISSLKRSLGSRASERDTLTVDLREDEKQLARKRQKLSEIEAERKKSEVSKAALGREQSARQAELEKEVTLLAAQVRAAYTSGNQERMKLLLNQQDPATFGRMLRYYQYLSSYRSANIETVTQNIDELAALKLAVSAEEERLASLATSRRVQLEELNKGLEHRRKLLVSLQQKIRSEGNEVSRLEQQEKDLQRLVAELGSILADYPIASQDPFSSHKGRLTWPVAGELLHDFGQPRASGGLKWNGVVLGAPRGREVRAVYNGRVVFADWLAGLGLLIIVDHGEGYMSLYGHNDTLLKNDGDWVGPGEVIATIGDSGGQLRTSLYFELRKGTKPINPRSWINRKPRTT